MNLPSVLRLSWVLYRYNGYVLVPDFPREGYIYYTLFIKYFPWKELIYKLKSGRGSNNFCEGYR